MLTTFARSVDLLALAFAFGSTAWFFFVQSPVLVKRMGRDRFVPLQMSLVGVLFKSLTVALFVMVGAAIAHSETLLSFPVITAALGLAGALINATLVVPRALKAGGKSLKEAQTSEEQKSVANFASAGGGDSSRFWHRAVVLFVVVMLAGLIPHGISLASSVPKGPHPESDKAQEDSHAVHAEPPSAHGAVALQLDDGKKWKANPETTEGAHKMLAIARQAAASTDTSGHALQATSHQLTEAYQEIFRRCTMTGPAHDQLHQFLVPMGELLARLEGSSGEAGLQALHQLQAHLEQYDRYFE